MKQSATQEEILDGLLEALYWPGNQPSYLPKGVAMEFAVFDQTENYSDLAEDEIRWTFTVYLYREENGEPIDSISCDTIDAAVKFVHKLIKEYHLYE